MIKALTGVQYNTCNNLLVYFMIKALTGVQYNTLTQSYNSNDDEIKDANNSESKANKIINNTEQ